MIILDPGHIYQIPSLNEVIDLKFMKRGGGAITYPQEWPGIQTQAVMRVLIDYLGRFEYEIDETHTYHMWQLGANSLQPITLSNLYQVLGVLEVIDDRSRYLNDVLECVETSDARSWLQMAAHVLRNPQSDNRAEDFAEAIQCIRMALWCYEARAYRRKQEAVNRKDPAHDDSVTPKAWRHHQCDDVPFNEFEIELREIGLDGHIVLNKEDLEWKTVLSPTLLPS